MLVWYTFIRIMGEEEEKALKRIENFLAAFSNLNYI